MFVSLFGILIFAFGLISLYIVFKIDEEELPVPKERLFRLCAIIILVGLLIYELGKINQKIIDYYSPALTILKI